VDAQNALEAIDEFDQIKSQIAVADTLLITKCDLVSAATIAKLHSRVSSLNPRARVEELIDGKIDARAVFGQCVLDPTASAKELRSAIREERQNRASAEGEQGDSISSSDKHSGIQSFVITRDKPMSFSVLDQFLRSLQGYRGQDLLRIKGLVYLQDRPNRPSVIHGVQGQMHPPTTLKRWPSDARKTELVFITRDISYGDVDNLLSGIEGSFR